MRVLITAAMLALLLPRPGAAAWWRPRWTREKPAIALRREGRVASAVGYARLDSLPLSRDAAQERARARILELMERSAGDETARGWVRGARVVQEYVDRHGGVYVRLESPLP